MHLCKSVTKIPKDPGALATLRSLFTTSPLLARTNTRICQIAQARARSPSGPSQRSPALLPLVKPLMDASSFAPRDTEQTSPVQEEATAAAAATEPSVAAATLSAASGALKRKADNADKPAGRKQKKTGGDPKKIRTSQLIGEIAQHAKHNRLQPAMAAFRAAVEEDLKLGTSMFNTLLYLSCGGNNWEAYARGQPIPKPNKESAPPAPTKEELIESTHTLWAHMQKEGMQAEHATYLSLARIEAIKGNATEALNWAKTSVAADQPTHLRLFHPALVSFMLLGDMQSMLEVDRLIASFGKEQLDLSEYEYAVLLEGLTQHGAWTQLTDLLHRVGKELNQLSPPTLAILESYFKGPRSAEAFDAATRQQREAVAEQEEVQLLRVRQQQHEAAWEQRQLAKERLRQVQEQQAARREAWASEARTQTPAAAVPSLKPPRQTGSPTAALLPEGGPARADPEPTPAPRSPLASSSAPAAAASPAPGPPPTLPEEEKRQRRPWLGYGEAKAWRVSSSVAMDASSNCLEAAGGLRPLVVDLEEQEWSLFSAAVASLAMSLEQRKSDFQHYMDWYERNGPYDILIDGANVAFYGQNREGGGFSWKQIIAMVQRVQEQYPNKKVLLMLHTKRVSDPSAQTRRVVQFLDGLRATKSFYFTPPGSNDDWYWLYATVKARGNGLLVSNDELRDHIWSLLRPKHFLKWKSRHIAHYTFVAPSDPKQSTWLPELSPPQAFTECVQELEDGSWVFPCTNKTWLCVSPAAE